MCATCHDRPSYVGRHSARLNAPNADTLLMPVPTAADPTFKAGSGAGRYRVRFAARSSPAGVLAGATFAQCVSMPQSPPAALVRKTVQKKKPLSFL